jgi:hypothetical protein
VKTLIKYGIRPVDINFQPSPDKLNVMRVTRRSDLSGKENTMDMPVTEDQLRNWLGTPSQPGQLIQNVMPHLSAEQREFLISGCTPEEWAKITDEEA